MAYLPQAHNLFYRYNFEIRKDDNDDDDASVVMVEETDFRSFQPSNNRVLHDIFSYPGHGQVDYSKGLEYNLQSLSNESSTDLLVKHTLHDLEHLWLQYSEKLLTPFSVKFLHDWAEKQLNEYSSTEQRSNKLLIPIIVYGTILQRSSHETFCSETLSKLQFRSIRNKIATLSRRMLTPWSIPHILQTGLAVLKKLYQLHWLTVVAFFGKLYDRIDSLLEIKESVNEDKLTIETVLNSVIPRILGNFANSQQITTKVLLEIPSGWGFNETEKKKLSQVVGRNIPDHESTPKPISSKAKDSKNPTKVRTI